MSGCLSYAFPALRSKMLLDLVFEMCSCTLYSLFHFRLSLKDAKKDFMSLFILNISANAMGHHFAQITQDCFKAYESEGKYCAKESYDHLRASNHLYHSLKIILGIIWR